jgi:DDE superfamily endonuclease
VALSEAPRPGASRKLSGKEEALQVSTACSSPPVGRARGPWNCWLVNWSGSLSTHSAGALYQSLPACEARRVLRRLEFHYVPKHASWLNMVEIEIGVLAKQCLDRRIKSHAKLAAETAAWEKQRNAARARIKWMFTTDKARAKWARLSKT